MGAIFVRGVSQGKPVETRLRFIPGPLNAKLRRRCLWAEVHRDGALLEVPLLCDFQRETRGIPQFLGSKHNKETLIGSLVPRKNLLPGANVFGAFLSDRESSEFPDPPGRACTAPR